MPYTVGLKAFGGLSASELRMAFMWYLHIMLCLLSSLCKKTSVLPCTVYSSTLYNWGNTNIWSARERSNVWLFKWNLTELSAFMCGAVQRVMLYKMVLVRRGWSSLELITDSVVFWLSFRFTETEKPQLGITFCVLLWFSRLVVVSSDLSVLVSPIVCCTLI